MSTPSIKVGQGNWGVKALSLLGYANTDKKFVARDFTVGRLLNTATRVNASGNIEGVNANIPRIDYFGGQASLLVEPSAQNLALQSENFGTTWAPTNITVTTGSTAAFTAPDGTTSADLLTASASGSARIIQSFSFVSGTTYTYSAFAKAGSGFFGLTMENGFVASGAAVIWNLNTGALAVSGTTGAGYTLQSQGIENYGNGWYRCRMTVLLGLNVAGNIRANTSDGTMLSAVIQSASGNTAYVWGAQLETGSVATSYIPTTTGTVTRNNDNISLTGVSGLIGQTEGTIYAEAAYSNIDAVKTFAAITDGTTNNRIALRINSTISIAATIVVAGSANSITQSIPAIPSSGVLKIALGYKANDYALAINGTIYHFTTTRPVPATSAVTLGHNGFNADFFNDRIRAVSIYQTRLPNTTTDGSPSLQSITTL